MPQYRDNFQQEQHFVSVLQRHYGRDLFGADKSHSDKPGNSLSVTLIRQGIENLSVKVCDGQSIPGDKSVSIFSGHRTEAEKGEGNTNHRG